MSRYESLLHRQRETSLSLQKRLRNMMAQQEAAAATEKRLRCEMKQQAIELKTARNQLLRSEEQRARTVLETETLSRSFDYALRVATSGLRTLTEEGALDDPWKKAVQKLISTLDDIRNASLPA
jgi:hypothetical protein